MTIDLKVSISRDFESTDTTHVYGIGKVTLKKEF